MASRNEATLNLSSLLKHDLAEGGEVSGEGALTPDPALLTEMGLDLAGPLDWQLTARATGGDDYLLTGTVGGVATIECRRCLSEVPTELHADILYPMEFRPGTEGLQLLEMDDEEGGDLLVFGEPHVDFAELLAQVYAIELPLTVLCKEDCKGLSPEGVNLNDHPELEVTETETVESPFAVLKDLKVKE